MTKIKTYNGDNIKRWRIANDLTQLQMAEILGVSQSQVGRWEKSDKISPITLVGILTIVEEYKKEK